MCNNLQNRFATTYILVLQLSTKRACKKHLQAYELLVRCLCEQTIVEEGNRRLREKEDGGMDSRIMQNPSEFPSRQTYVRPVLTGMNAAHISINRRQASIYPGRDGTVPGVSGK